MINFNFSILNPWSDTYDHLFSKSGDTPFKNKHWEVEIVKCDTLLALHFSISHRCSHAGIMFEAALFGYSITASLYDSRHWDYARGEWEK